MSTASTRLNAIPLAPWTGTDSIWGSALLAELRACRTQSDQVTALRPIISQEAGRQHRRYRSTRPDLARRVTFDDFFVAGLTAGWQALLYASSRGPMAGQAITTIVHKRTRFDIGTWLRASGYLPCNAGGERRDALLQRSTAWDVESHADALADGYTSRLYDLQHALEVHQSLSHIVTRQELQWLRLVYTVGLEKQDAARRLGMMGKRWRKFEAKLIAKARELYNTDGSANLSLPLLARRLFTAPRRRQARTMKTSKKDGPARHIYVGPKVPHGPWAEAQIALVMSA